MTEDASPDGGTAGGPLFEALPGPAIRYSVSDGNSQVRAINPAFERTFDVDRTGLVGRSLSELLQGDGITVEIEIGLAEQPPQALDWGENTTDPSDGVETLDELLVQLRTEHDVAALVRSESADGTRYFRVCAVPNPREPGEGYLVFDDITDLGAAVVAAESRATRLERLASVAVHDLRNPLEVATIRLEAARETHEDVHYEKLQRSLDRIQEIVQDVLSVNSVSIDATTVVTVADVARAAWDTVDTGSATLSLPSTQTTIRADRSRLQQLFENLFRNAVEHAGTEVTIHVGDLDDGFYVADDGPGIRPSERTRVFEAGYSTLDDGSGLGLAIVDRIAEVHGWEVSLTTAEDGGARFEFTGVERADRAPNGS